MEASYEGFDQAISQCSIQLDACISLLLDAVCGWVLGICIQANHHSREALRCILFGERGSVRQYCDLVASLVSRWCLM